MIKTLEALISAIILLVSIVFLFPPTAFTQSQIPSISYNCLRYLDNSGFLRYDAENMKDVELTSKLKACMPANLDFSVKICSITTCNADSLPNKEVFLSSYMISGDQNSANRLINLWVWIR